MESERRKVYVEVNVTHRPDGTARPNFIKFENDEKYEIDRVIQKCRAASTKVGGTGIRYTVQICGKPTFLFDEENGKWFVEAKCTCGFFRVFQKSTCYTNETARTFEKGVS